MYDCKLWLANGIVTLCSERRKRVRAPRLRKRDTARVLRHPSTPWQDTNSQSEEHPAEKTEKSPKNVAPNDTGDAQNAAHRVVQSNKAALTEVQASGFVPRNLSRAPTLNKTSSFDRTQSPDRVSNFDRVYSFDRKSQSTRKNTGTGGELDGEGGVTEEIPEQFVLTFEGPNAPLTAIIDSASISMLDSSSSQSVSRIHEEHLYGSSSDDVLIFCG